MVSKADEINLYKAIYKLAFEAEAHFFYSNNSETIFCFLKEKFWGESLELRGNLLCKLLDYDAGVNPEMKKELKKKSAKLKQYLISPPQESDQPF